MIIFLFIFVVVTDGIVVGVILCQSNRTCRREMTCCMRPKHPRREIQKNGLRNKVAKRNLQGRGGSPSNHYGYRRLSV
ncbi:unnamed protein product [Lathyrus oleraceus]